MPVRPDDLKKSVLTVSRMRWVSRPPVKSFLEFWGPIEPRAIYQLDSSCHNPQLRCGADSRTGFSLATFRLNSPADSLVFSKKACFSRRNLVKKFTMFGPVVVCIRGNGARFWVANFLSPNKSKNISFRLDTVSTTDQAKSFRSLVDQLLSYTYPSEHLADKAFSL